MAYVLSLRPHSPLKRSFSDNPYLQSCSPLKGALLSPLGNVTARNTSTCSLYSFGSNRGGDWFSGNENTPPITSQSSLNLVPESDSCPLHIKPARKRRDAAPPPHDLAKHVPTSSKLLTTEDGEPQRRSDVDLNDDEKSGQIMDPDDDDFQESELFSLYESIHVPPPTTSSHQNAESNIYKGGAEKDEVDFVSSMPFRRWMSTLRRRHHQSRRHHKSENLQLSLHIEHADENIPSQPRHWSKLTHRTSESMSSSMANVTAVKSASITIASTSIAPRSEVGLNGRRRIKDKGSTYSEARRSLESHHGPQCPIIDERAWLRSLQRRKIVEELVVSEESYIADLKVLINDYLPFTDLPTLSGQTRISIQQNIAHILQLHEDLLFELYRVVPQSDFTRSAYQETYPLTKAKHIRFHSADIHAGRFSEHRVARRLRHSLDIGRSPDRRPRGLLTETKTVGDIARIFNKHMKRFFTYEEYGAHWTTMSHDLATMSKGLHGWQEYERGVEALQKIIASENNKDAGSRKALSFPDLLIKPIQRVCKYPLLFDDLCRQTPVYDDPEAHAELEKALFRLQETIREVNKAKDDPKTRRLIEITWQLQDRFEFQEQPISRALIFRLLGHVLLCGVLHVTHQTTESRIKGQYMVCVLYKSCLILATSSRFHVPFTVVASIGLANSSIEGSDNGRGVQCHTAPHTWKLVFEHNSRLHEVLLSACSSHEEGIWTTQLRERIVCETRDFVEGQSSLQDIFSLMTLDIKSLGPVFGHTDSLIRRMSVHRAATLGAKTSTSQVIIKNTQAQKQLEQPPTFSPSLVTRSQSLMSSNHVPILAPRRADRIRLEHVLEEIWTKDILPYPGMSNKRVENQIRASANSVMRKLSMASLASNFSRRSPSFSSMGNARSEGSSSSRVNEVPAAKVCTRPTTERRPAPTVVDFHTAPAAFLPTDFEIQDTRPSSRRRRLANRAAGNERSIDKTSLGRKQRVRRLSTHVINLPKSESSAPFAARSAIGSNVTVQCLTEPPVSDKLYHNLATEPKKATRDSSPREVNAGLPSSKRFQRSRSKIFRFWV